MLYNAGLVFWALFTGAHILRCVYKPGKLVVKVISWVALLILLGVCWLAGPWAALGASFLFDVVVVCTTIVWFVRSPFPLIIHGRDNSWSIRITKPGYYCYLRGGKYTPFEVDERGKVFDLGPVDKDKLELLVNIGWVTLIEE